MTPIAHPEPSLPSAFPSAELSEVVRRLSLVPSAYRVFQVDAREAARLYRIGPTLLRRLLDLGLPHRGRGDDLRLDRLDVENIGLALRLATPRWTAMRSWRRCLRACPRSGQVRHRLTVEARCPVPAPHHCDLALHPLAVAAAEAASVRRRADGFDLDLTVAAVDHQFGEPFPALAEAVAGLEFHLLPAPLVADLDFVARTGLSDCAAATQLLIRAGREHGIRLRPAVGYLLTTPFPTWHQWIEVDAGAGWLAADPFILGVFARWGVVDAAQWPVNRSPQGILWRCHTDPFPVVTHAGGWVAPRLVLGTSP